MSVLTAKPAPDFTAPAVLADGSVKDAFTLSEEIKGQYAVLFFYPKDFTFVCPSELIALDHRIDAFKERNCAVIGVSIDSENVHMAWRNTPVDKGGIGALKYPLVADIKHEICQAYDVEHEAGIALRGAFIIDASGTVRAQIVNDLPIGRDADEILRIIDAIQFTEEHGEVCPAGWKKGSAGMTATADGVADYLSKNADKL